MRSTAGAGQPSGSKKGVAIDSIPAVVIHRRPRHPDREEVLASREGLEDREGQADLELLDRQVRRPVRSCHQADLEGREGLREMDRWDL